MQRYTREIADWAAAKHADAEQWLAEMVRRLRGLLERPRRAAADPRRKTARPDAVRGGAATDPRELAISGTHNPDRLYQLALVGLGIAIVGLGALGLLYLIVGWAMR